jgi:hypothetical protein
VVLVIVVVVVVAVVVVIIFAYVYRRKAQIGLFAASQHLKFFSILYLAMRATGASTSTCAAVTLIILGK